MQNWRAVKDVARNIVHKTMTTPAYLYRGNAQAALVYVRLHNLQATHHGDLQGARVHYAVREDQNPTVICRTGDYDPVNLDVLCFRVGECYRVENVQEPDFITTTAEVLRLEASDAMRYIPPPPPPPAPSVF